MLNVIKKVLTFISIALISSFIYSTLGTVYTQITNGVIFNLLYFLELFPHYLSGILPYFILVWIPLGLLIERKSKIKGYFVNLIVYCSGGIVSFFIFESLRNFGDIYFLSLVTYSLIFGGATAIVFFHTMLLYKVLDNQKWKDSKRFHTSFVFVIAIFVLGVFILFTNTGERVNPTLEEYYSLEELQKSSPLSFKLPSYLPDGIYFDYGQVYQDQNEINITISYTADNEREYDLNTLTLHVSDVNLKNFISERSDQINEIFINKNKGFIGHTAIVDDFKYIDTSLMWKQNEIYYAVISDVHQNSILDENELMNIAESFN